MEWTKDVPVEPGYYLLRRPINGRLSFPTCVHLHGGVWLRPIPVAQEGAFGGATLILTHCEAWEQGAEFCGPLESGNDD